MEKLIIGQMPELDYAATEAFNTLATNLSFCGEQYRRILLTSRFASEGKSSTAMYLTKTLAMLGKSVVLVDGDLRRSKLMSTFGIRYQNGQGQKEHPGLVHYLAGQCGIDDIIYSTSIEGAYMIPVGRDVSSSLQLLASGRLKELMDYLSNAADMVIVDSAPAGVIVDALEMAKNCDGALITVGYKQGHRSEIAALRKSIERSGCTVLGAVLNQVPANDYKSRKYYYSYGKYGYYKYDKDDESK